MVERQVFREGMSRLGAAVSLITTNGPAGRHGFTASAVCSVTDSPPTLLVCMNRSVSSHDAFRTNGTLCVNVLTGEQQKLSEIFATSSIPMEDRFGGGSWLEGAKALPVLMGSVVSFQCEVAEWNDIGTHTVVFCNVLDVTLSDPADALLYFGRAYHRLPFTKAPPKS